MDNVINEYFKSINPLATKISFECDHIKNKYGSQWMCLSTDEQESILDAHFFKNSLVEKYDLKDLWKIESGEKVVVDFNQDEMGWTWTDEHSGPFSWKTKSQQDLSLSNLCQTLEDETKKRSSSKDKKFNQKESVEIDDVFIKEATTDAANFQHTSGNEENKGVQRIIKNYEDPTYNPKPNIRTKRNSAANTPTKINTLRGLKGLSTLSNPPLEMTPIDRGSNQASNPLDDVAKQPVSPVEDDVTKQPTSPLTNVNPTKKTGFDFLDNW